jgi:hypothetical protein
MSAWSSDELTRIGATEEVRLASARPDGTLRKPVVVWLVREGDDLYVRSVNGRGAAWFRGVQDRHEGRLWAGSVEKDVQLVEADDRNEEIDAAYQAKYRRYASIVPSIVKPEARAATLRLVPRG